MCEHSNLQAMSQIFPNVWGGGGGMSLISIITLQITAGVNVHYTCSLGTILLIHSIHNAKLGNAGA